MEYLSFVIFAGYLTYIYFKFGIQKSISESYYRLPQTQKFIFTLFIWGFSIPLIFVEPTILFFVAVGFICFVGAATTFKNFKTTFYVHMVGAYGGIILALLSINWMLILLMAVFFVLAKRFLKNYIWWVEIFAFLLIFIGLNYKG